MTEIPKSIDAEVKLGFFSRIMEFIKRQRLEFQARLSLSPYLNQPPGGSLSAETKGRIKRFEDEAIMELGKRID